MNDLSIRKSTQNVSKRRPWRSLGRVFLILFCLGLLLAPASAAALAGPGAVFPEVIPLPNGFSPEGIVIGRGTTFYVGSLATGAIFEGDLRTGQGEIRVPAQEGRVIVGLSYDPRTNWIYAAGGPTGSGYIFDASTGEEVDTFQFTSDPSFFNDVVVTRTAAYFTDSSHPLLYEVPLEPSGSVVEGAGFREIPLGGDFVFEEGAFNANGIDATPNGKWLIIVHSSRGELYRVDPATGQATLIDLGGETLPNGDGILLHGRTLYVVQNRLNQIAVVRLDFRLQSGQVVDVLTNPNFDVPTTIDKFGNALYAVNARFGTPVTPDTEYQVVRVTKH